MQWDAGTNGVTWSNLAGYSSNYIELEYQSTANVAAGVTYQIRVRARNYWGWGYYSDVLSIKASTVPDKVSTPVTSIEATTGGIRVTWT